MSDTTDLSKLSSNEIIGRILNLRLTLSDEEEKSSLLSAKLHPLIVVLKQAVIREASVATYDSKENEEGLRWILVHTDIAPKFECDAPRFAGLLATPEELANMKKESP
jgi:hypothetical protein